MTNSSHFTVTQGVNLIGGGLVNEQDINDIRKSGKSLFCADSGLNYALKNNLLVSGLIGDLDSVDSQKDATYPVLFDQSQDTNDLEKSLDVINAKYIICYGFLGGRLDHSLASFNVISKTKQVVFLIGEEDVCVVCPKNLKLNLPIGTRFALFPMDKTFAKSKGLMWNLDGILMSPNGRISTSNESIEKHIEIWIDDGLALAIFPRNTLPTIINQWPF